MSGKELRDKLKSNKVKMADLARFLGISPQDLRSKLKAKSLKEDFVKNVNEFVYDSKISDSNGELIYKQESDDNIEMIVLEQQLKAAKTVITMLERRLKEEHEDMQGVIKPLFMSLDKLIEKRKR